MKRRKPFRLVSDEPFPPYAYVPTRFPHPVRDPKGHNYEKEHGHSHAERGNEKAPKPERWQECRLYLYGIDLFNEQNSPWSCHGVTIQIPSPPKGGEG